MSEFRKEYTDLDRALDEIPSALEEWLDTQKNPRPTEDTVYHARLVLHEWIANLHQHADFEEEPPTVEIHLVSVDRHIDCSVTDNSEGFDLETHLPTKPKELVEVLPDRGMGLRIINACTKSVSYSPTDDGHHRFEFFIPSDHEPWLSMLF